MRVQDSVARRRMWDAAPVVVIALVGAAWIATHAEAGRGQVHTLFQVLALAENVAALLLRRRKPVGAWVGILVVYFLVDLVAVTLLPVLLALFTVVLLKDRRHAAPAAAATVVVVGAMPYLHGDRSSVLTHLAPAAAVLGAAIAGGYLRTRREAAQPSVGERDLMRR